MADRALQMKPSSVAINVDNFIIFTLEQPKEKATQKIAKYNKSETNKRNTNP